MVALAVVVLVTLFRLWYVTCLDLVPDEAYYWVWSKHLALSYRDKGPAIAWTIALGTRLFGDTVFGVRVLGALLSAGSAYQLFRLAERLYDARAGLWCVGVAVVIPMMAVGSIVMTIDSLSVFFWAWAANLFWVALESGRTRHWLYLGLAIGAGFLAKFTNGVQLVGLAWFLWWSRSHRRFLLSRQSLVTLLAFGVCLLPMFWWNIETGWVHAQALHDRSGVQQSFGVHPGEVFHYLEEQLGVLSPPILLGMVVAASALWWKHGDEARVQYLLSQFVPVQALFLFFSLNKAGKSNWIAPSLIAGIVLLVVFWRSVASARPRWRWAVWVSLGVSALITIFLHLAPALTLPRRLDPLRRAEGWLDFASHVQHARWQHQPDLLIANHYSQASMIQFYLPDHPVTYLPPAAYGTSQFTLWPGYQLHPGTRALYVTDDGGPLPEKVREEFGARRLIDDFWTEHHGRRTSHFCIYLLENR